MPSLPTNESRSSSPSSIKNYADVGASSVDPINELIESSPKNSNKNSDNPPRSSQESIISVDSIQSLLIDSDFSIINEIERVQHLNTSEMLLDAEERAHKREKKRFFVISLIVAFLAFFGYLSFILYPRQPTFNLKSLNIDPDSPTFELPNPDGSSQLFTKWKAIFVVNNPNFISLKMYGIDLDIFLSKDKNNSVGNGYSSNLFFPAKSQREHVIDLKIPVYSPSSGKPSLIAECMVNESLNLFIKARIDLNIFHWTGRTIDLAFNIVTKCEIPAGGKASLKKLFEKSSKAISKKTNPSDKDISSINSLIKEFQTNGEFPDLSEEDIGYLQKFFS